MLVWDLPCLGALPHLLCPTAPHRRLVLRALAAAPGGAHSSSSLLPNHLVPGLEACPSAGTCLSTPVRDPPGAAIRIAQQARSCAGPASSLGGAPGAPIKGRRQLSTSIAAMLGVSLEGLAQAGAAELAELRQELGAFRGVVEGQLEQALQRVQPMVLALRSLEEEHWELRAELARLGRRLDLLVLWMGLQDSPGEDLSTLFLEAQDPCAHFEGTEELSGPVAHPPTFSSTRQQSALHLSRSNSGVSAGSPAPWQCLVVGWGVAPAHRASDSPGGA